MASWKEILGGIGLGLGTIGIGALTGGIGAAAAGTAIGAGAGAGAAGAAGSVGTGLLQSSLADNPTAAPQLAKTAKPTPSQKNPLEDRIDALRALGGV